MKCCACNKEIYNGKLVSGDGDFVCDERCEKKLYKHMERLSTMTDTEFKQWIKYETN